MTSQTSSTVHVPRVAIKFCTQCKWNLRAAYYAQELLQTFSTGIGEVALIPVTGGIFTVTLTHPSSPPSGELASGPVTDTVIWDRKAEGRFPETKELKNRVRNIIEPGRDLGHIDRSLKKNMNNDHEPQVMTEEKPGIGQEDDGAGSGKATKEKECEDCK